MPPTNQMDDALCNQLLAALPTNEFLKIRSGLENVELKAGEVLYEAETKGRHIYFPTDSLILLLYESDTGVSMEVGLIGNQGMIGVSAIMGDTPTATRAVVYRSGSAYRMAAPAVKDEFGECGDFQDMCLYFAQSLLAQITQSAVCNRLHSVEQQLCRLLIRMHDLQETDLLRLTHEQIDHALGVRRETVSLAASALQSKELIKYTRGRITLLDRKGLEGFACECYQLETQQHEKLMKKYEAKHN